MDTKGAADKLGRLLRGGGSSKEVEQYLTEFESAGLQRKAVINEPIKRYYGRTAVHLATNNYANLKLLLKYGGKLFHW